MKTDENAMTSWCSCIDSKNARVFECRTVSLKYPKQECCHVAIGGSRHLLVSVILLAPAILGVLLMNSMTVESFPISNGSDFVLRGITYPFPVSIGDLNNDSLDDIVVGSRDAMNPEVGVYYQRTNRTFNQLPDIKLSPGKASCVAVGDLNNDTLVDVAAASWMGHTVSIFYQRTDNTLNSTGDVVLPLSSGATYIAVSDLNDDGLNDIAVSQAGVTIFYQKSNNTFGPGADTKLSSPGGPEFVLADDLNTDGLKDLAAANTGGDTVTVYYQNPDSTMPTSPNVTLDITSSTTSIPAPSALATGDLNGDGLIDLAVGSINAENNAVVAFFQQEDHTLPSTPNLTISFNRGTRAVAISDLNSDGLDDLLAANYRNDFDATVYYQRCNHSIPTTPDLKILTGATPNSVAIAKLNNDSMNDIVIANLYSHNVAIYFQETPGSFLLPDFSVNSANLTVTPSDHVLNGTMVFVNTIVSNDGECMGCAIPYAFYDGDPSAGGQLIGGGVIDSLSPMENTSVQTSWMATPYGVHDIYIVLDPDNLTLESNETNNVATISISVTSLRPPTLADAVLTGNDLENVTLNWSLSPDDGVGLEIVTGYRIYRNLTYDSDGLGYSPIASLPNSTSTFADPGAGEGDPNHYFYRVCARDVNNTTACSSTQAGKFTRPLTKGPNLASAPLIQSDESVETVLQTVEFDKVWVYDSFDEKWKWYMAFKDYRRGLFNINQTMGIWINVTQNSNLTVAGIVPAQTPIHLYEGWNLVSFPSVNVSHTVGDMKASLPVERVEGFDPAPPYFLRVLSDSDVLLAGRAYWVRVQADVEWIVTFQ